ncbi:hypothetical protein OZX69_02980 [Lactobacillus sp. ESL0731]|uniref:hypothetical protein n=1 Tax=unclassified Lactobacillus TaxID=2620435 RepID=UPI0023F918A7|nr:MULTISPECIES: hypothetical protein [unclassified Lactobacillus]WEV51674.1 hypothetical protein OZX63_02980 [Lactobacillus sp. ESL0700]WEV62803.1 hypothetical protein OZX69_02980 [Lactobacillus sp. ESL0731]
MAESKTDTTVQEKPISTVTKQENRFTKKAILNSNLFETVDKDILRTVLEDDKTYTIEELQVEIKKFKGGI